MGVKRFVLENGVAILNCSVVVSITALSISAIALTGYLAIIIIPLIILTVIAVAFPLYLLVDIRDSLAKNNAKSPVQEKTESIEGSTQISQEEMMKLLK